MDIKPVHFISVMVVHHGKTYDISRSKMRNSIPIRKNFMENGRRGVCRGSNPHSYMPSLSGVWCFFLVMVEMSMRDVENIILPSNSAAMGMYSSCFMFEAVAVLQC